MMVGHGRRGRDRSERRTHRGSSADGRTLCGSAQHVFSCLVSLHTPPVSAPRPLPPVEVALGFAVGLLDPAHKCLSSARCWGRISPQRDKVHVTNSWHTVELWGVCFKLSHSDNHITTLVQLVGLESEAGRHLNDGRARVLRMQGKRSLIEE